MNIANSTIALTDKILLGLANKKGLETQDMEQKKAAYLSLEVSSNTFSSIRWRHPLVAIILSFIILYCYLV